MAAEAPSPQARLGWHDPGECSVAGCAERATILVTVEPRQVPSLGRATTCCAGHVGELAEIQLALVQLQLGTLAGELGVAANGS